MFQDGVKKTISSSSVRTSASNEGHLPTRSSKGPNQKQHKPDTAPKPQAAREIWHDKHWFPSLPFQQFQVLFNSLFKVLCIFPSRYLCAIGLPPIFSFMWHLPQNLCWNPNQHDSLKACAMAHSSQTRTGVSPSQLPFSKGLGPGLQPTILLQTTIRCTQKTGVKWVTQIHTVSFTLFSRPY